MRCKGCGFVYCGRIPTAAELDDLYLHYPHYEGIDPITRSRYQDLLDLFERERRTNNILDSGTGSGFFLDEAAGRGWNAHGSEYDTVVVNACRERGISMWQGALEMGSFPSGHFDVITSFEVMEHLGDPMAELRCFRHFLRPGGSLYITTPNFNALSRSLAGSDWSVVTYPEHLNYFTPNSIGRALRSAGFRVRWVHTTGISPGRLLQSRTPVNTNASEEGQGATDRRLRRRIENSHVLSFAKRAVNGSLSLTGKGDTLKVLAVRED